MDSKRASACGKIILSGEYAVVFGFPGIAVPANVRTSIVWEATDSPLSIVFDPPVIHPEAEQYVRKIIALCEKHIDTQVRGTVRIENSIPLGKGMGSSTALVIALCRCLIGPNCEAQAKAIEDIMNPGHSGLDFAVIWHERPVLFRKGTEPQSIDLSSVLLENAVLIDTGTPSEPTPELVAWMKSREAEVRPYLEAIGRCTERLRDGESPMTVFPDHHRAQVALGVVPPAVQEMITKIEQKGGAAKVLGAGAKTGGGGMVLGLGILPEQKTSILERGFTIIEATRW